MARKIIDDHVANTVKPGERVTYLFGNRTYAGIVTERRGHTLRVDTMIMGCGEPINRFITISDLVRADS